MTYYNKISIDRQIFLLFVVLIIWDFIGCVGEVVELMSVEIVDV